MFCRCWTAWLSGRSDGGDLSEIHGVRLVIISISAGIRVQNVDAGQSWAHVNAWESQPLGCSFNLDNKNKQEGRSNLSRARQRGGQWNLPEHFPEENNNRTSRNHSWQLVTWQLHSSGSLMRDVLVLADGLCLCSGWYDEAGVRLLTAAAMCVDLDVNWFSMRGLFDTALLQKLPSSTSPCASIWTDWPPGPNAAEENTGIRSSVNKPSPVQGRPGLQTSSAVNKINYWNYWPAIGLQQFKVFHPGQGINAGLGQKCHHN